MKTTRLAARRAKPISWVTTTIVIPECARLIMTSRTSLIISGSRAEVGSSKSITLGSIASDRAIATRCCWPPESWAGYFSRLLGDPDSLEQLHGALLSVCLARPCEPSLGPSVTFSRIVLWANRLNDWKTMPTSARSWARALPSSGSGLAVDRDRARLEGVEPVDRTAERRLARPGWTDDHDDLTFADREVDVFEHVQLAEVLVDAPKDD